MRLGLLAILVVVLAACSSGAGGDPLSAKVMIYRDLAAPAGAGGIRMVDVTDAAQIKALEAFFPNYRSRPSVDVAGGWDMKYEVYFNFAGGQTIRVWLPDDGKVWTCGHGDLKTNGDFAGFVGKLK